MISKNSQNIPLFPHICAKHYKNGIFLAYIDEVLGYLEEVLGYFDESYRTTASSNRSFIKLKTSSSILDNPS